MKKTTLSLAVIAALGVSAPAWAGIGLDVLPDPTIFISEAKINESTGSGVTPAPIIHPIGVQLSASKSYYVRYKLVGGTGVQFATPGASDLELCTATDTSGPSSTPVCSGGTLTASSVDVFDNGATLVFSVTTGTTGFTQGQYISLATDIASIKNENSISLEYGLYSDQGPANSGNTTSDAHLGGQTAEYFNFSKSGYTHSSIVPKLPNINVSIGSTAFETPSTSQAGATDMVPVCQFTLTPTADTHTLGGTANAVSDTSFAWLTKWTMTLDGDFSAVDGAGDKVWFSKDDDCSSMYGAFTKNTTDDTYEYSPSSGSVPGTLVSASSNTDPIYVCIGVDGTTPITPSAYSLTFSGNGATDYENPNPTAGIDFECAETQKGGSNASIPLVLAPTSIWKQFIRITNPSTTEGKVYLNVYNDAGEKAGVTPSFDLPAGQSTALLNIPSILSAAGIDPASNNASDPIPAPTLSTGTRNKFRLEVEAEFGSNDLGTGVMVRSYILPDTTNQSSFTQFD